MNGSVRRSMVVGSVGLLLCGAVAGTYGMKRVLFGSTPFVYSVELAMSYGFDSMLAMVGTFARSSLASAAAPFVGSKKETISTPARSIPVLTYHRILNDTDANNVTERMFRDQMTTLKKAGWNTVTLQEFEEFMRGERELPEKSFLLTFDDGAKDSFYPVDPILYQLDYHGVLFVIVQSSRTPKSTYYLTPEEITRVLSTGRWSIGSHSFDGHHPYPVNAEGKTGIFFADKLWLKIPERIETDDEFTSRVRTDLQRAQYDLEKKYGVPIHSFAFPLGNETNIEGAANFPEGASITEREADTIYEFGYLQTDNQDFTFNFPRTNIGTTSLADTFLVRRIHVDYDWDGKRLLEIMENGLPKTIPFEDDFATNRGWIPAWGSLSLGRNNLELSAGPTITSASTFLDGSAPWNDYSFEASINWSGSYVLVLADVVNSKTYHACAFAPNSVKIQTTIDGQTETLEEVSDARIQYSDAARVGIRVHGAVIECTWNFESIAEAYSRDFQGGVGIQTWDPTPGTAHVQVSSVIARPFATTTQ